MLCSTYETNGNIMKPNKYKYSSFYTDYMAYHLYLYNLIKQSSKGERKKERNEEKEEVVVVVEEVE